MEINETVISAASFVLAIVVFSKELRRIANDADMNPIRKDLEDVIAKELPSSLTRYLLNRKNQTETEDGDIYAEVYKDEVKDSLRKLEDSMQYLNYVKPYIYKTLSRKDFQLRADIEHVKTDKDERKIKRKVKSYINFINRLLCGQAVIHLAIWEHIVNFVIKIPKCCKKHKEKRRFLRKVGNRP